LSAKKTGKKTNAIDAPELSPKISASPLLLEIPPSEIPARLKEDVCRWKRQIDNHKEYFMGKGINPFREAHEILLSFLDNFDKVAGMKAK
jgi:hypothetical protein